MIPDLKRRYGLQTGSAGGGRFRGMDPHRGQSFQATVGQNALFPFLLCPRDLATPRLAKVRAAPSRSLHRSMVGGFGCPFRCPLYGIRFLNRLAHGWHFQIFDFCIPCRTLRLFAIGIYKKQLYRISNLPTNNDKFTRHRMHNEGFLDFTVSRCRILPTATEISARCGWQISLLRIRQPC